MNKLIKTIAMISVILLGIILFNNSQVEANSDTLLWVDNITNNGKTVNISGWVMSADKNATVKVLIQNTNTVSTDFERFEREDVLKSIIGYGGKNTNTKPGYSGIIDISNLSDGIYNLEIQVISSNNTVLAKQTSTIKLRNL